MKKKVFIFSGICLLLDFMIKIIVRNTMTLYKSIEVVPNFFRLTYVINDGAAFSILKGKQIFLILLAVSVLTVLFVNLRKENLTKLKRVYYSLLIGGILGNMLDRIIYQGVIDYLDFTILSYDAPIFNLADTFIFIGVVLILVEGVRKKDGTRSIGK